MSKVRKVCFFEKKKQKTFAIKALSSSSGGDVLAANPVRKVTLFHKKDGVLLTRPTPAGSLRSV
jgi:hypothetical protein